MSNIGVIGYKNQASKIINILKKKKFKLYIYIKNKKKFADEKKVTYTTNLEILKKKCSTIFIASPSKTHIKYIYYFSKYKKYIFCEKPPFTKLSDYKKLNSLSSASKNKIYFNFNYKFSPFYIYCKKILNDKDYGLPIHFFWHNSHGLAFKKKIKKSNNIFDNITGNLGIHFVNLYLNLFKKINKINFKQFKILNKGIENATINLQTKNISGTIIMSYSSVAKFYGFLMLTNSILEIQNGTTTLLYPRDNFDKYGNYVSPRKKTIKKFKNMNEHNQFTLLKSINYFLSEVEKKKYFSVSDFNIAIKSNKLFLMN
jgi:predicted dehydrogenase